jgi:hypothetical protein
MVRVRFAAVNRVRRDGDELRGWMREANDVGRQAHLAR